MTPAAFRLLFPAFIDATDAEINAAIALSAPYFNVGRWRGFYNEGLGNFVAHQIVVARAAATAGINVAAAGDVTEKRVGSVSVGRGAELLATQMADPFQRTLYGQRYKYLTRFAGAGALVV